MEKQAMKETAGARREILNGGFQSYALSTNSLAGGPSNDFLPGRIPNIASPLFYGSACCVYEGSAEKLAASFLYFGINLFCLFFSN
jgi:hypothetical protein